MTREEQLGVCSLLYNIIDTCVSFNDYDDMTTSLNCVAYAWVSYYTYCDGIEWEDDRNTPTYAPTTMELPWKTTVTSLRAPALSDRAASMATARLDAQRAVAAGQLPEMSSLVALVGGGGGSSESEQHRSLGVGDPSDKSRAYSCSIVYEGLNVCLDADVAFLGMSCGHWGHAIYQFACVDGAKTVGVNNPSDDDMGDDMDKSS